ncbi:MAG TPA: hypothetical protein PLO63_00615 [Syntrophales bacterium]|nr:hypothetical protein [Syntrophales bacterium]
MNGSELIGWDRLRHGGLLLDATRLRRIAEHEPAPLSSYQERELRRQAGAHLDGGKNTTDFIRFVLEEICGFTAADASWQRGTQVGAEWGRRAVTGETIKPRHLWHTAAGACLPVFIDEETRLGIGRGRRSMSQIVQWLRGGNERLAVLTNGSQWRLIFAGLDFDAWCEWDVELWFEGGDLSAQVTTLRTLLSPALWTPKDKGAPPPLLEAILESRKGQADLSAVLGERVREAVEILVQGHGDSLKEQCANCDPAEIYRAAVRMVMRMVVVLFAESRDLLPRDNALYHSAYGLTGLLEELEKIAARGGNRLARSWSAWPRLLALFRLVQRGSHHEQLPVPAYGGELFAPGDAASPDGLLRALFVFENACFERELLPDRDVHRMLERLTRTRVKLRQGRAGIWVSAPVDFSDLSSEYIGILYEGLLDFELKTAPAGDPVIFLAVGNQPALPLSRLEAMDDRALADLLEKMKDTGRKDDEAEDDGEAAAADDNDNTVEDDDAAAAAGEEEIPGGLFATAEEAATAETIEEPGDERHATRTRAETWARRAVAVGNLVRRPRGALTPERALVHEAAISRKARQLVVKVILPGEWYVVRWGGTRKGSGTFYTRPGLAVPTVHRTLRPLAYDPPLSADGRPDPDAPAASWTPKAPEAIVGLKVCDPACGSGSFSVAALRFLTDSLYASLVHYHRLDGDTGRSVEAILGIDVHESDEKLSTTRLPCRPEDDTFEQDMKAILKRFIVERCIYGVDFDPLAVELCRLALWVETMDKTLPFSFLDHKIKCGNSLVGAWLDQYQHYPVMAWKNREGGDKGHANGVHFAKEAWTKALKTFVKERLTPDLRSFLAGPTLFSQDVQTEAETVHADTLAVLARLHELPVHESTERARIYREEVVGAPAWQALKSALDIWCACWFWPADALDQAPLPTTFHAPLPKTRAIAERIAATKRFFHWEIEFPDVFCTAGSGFDAILGNPPWDIAKPNSKEFFSNIDPLYRAYGKQEALRHQTNYFADAGIERAWLDYNADFRAQSNFMGYAASPFGDPDENEASGDRFAFARGRDNHLYHARWRDARRKSRGFADPAHPFRHQGSADINLYKAFLEQAHALLRPDGRLGFIVPSGLYSDHGTGGLRRLFLDRCRWEWLFGFENRDKVFEIDSRFKFNPVIIQKGGATEAIQTAFMRRKLEDWENAEALATPYSRAQVTRFSPRSLAILEIQSRRDLEILEKIYANSVLLGDDGPDGWGIQYAREFDMTNDSRLFPPRPRWEADGYRPDEYSRWLKGNWRPIRELWAELSVDPTRPVSTPIQLEEWLYDTNAGPEERTALTRFVHGHLLKPGDVQRTKWKLRCAQPPYDTLPIPRADIPEGVILSREADAWIREDRIENTALPLYEGRMIGQFDFSQKGWISGKGRGAQWADIDWANKCHLPQYLMSTGTFLNSSNYAPAPKASLIAIVSATNTRGFICAPIPNHPCSHPVPVFRSDSGILSVTLSQSAVLNSLVFDWCFRARLGSGVMYVSPYLLNESPIPSIIKNHVVNISAICASLALCSQVFSVEWLSLTSPRFQVDSAWRTTSQWAMTNMERLRLRCKLDALIAAQFNLRASDFEWVLRECDKQKESMQRESAAGALSPKGFWRVDKNKDPELRQTVLTLVAFHDLEEKIHSHGGDKEKGIGAFLNQNNGEGWMLPETLRLADYGLGHDERAKRPQPVVSRLGPRFFDWQLTQPPEESWRECHLHARNLLGETGYKQLLADIKRPKEEHQAPKVLESPASYNQNKGEQGVLF